MPQCGPGPLALVHPVLIGIALAVALGYATWEALTFHRTRAAQPAVAAFLAFAAALGLGTYLRSLRGLRARLTRGAKGGMFLACLVPGVASAGSITLETTLSTQVAEVVRVTVLVRNTGDDVARDVRPRILLGGASRTGELVRELAPRGRHEWAFEVSRPARAGRHPLLATVAYNDAGFRGFSAVSAAVVDTGGGAVPPQVRGSLSSVALAGEGRVAVSVTNASAEARDVRLGLLLPDELGGWRALAPLRLPAGQSRTVDATIENRGALAGSRYAMYAVVQVAAGAVETTQLFSASASVVQTRAIDWQARLPEAAMYLGALFLHAEAALQALAVRTAPRRP